MKLLIIENPRPLTFEHYNDVANAPLSASLNSGYALAVARRVGWDTAYLDFTSGTDTPETIAAAILAEGADVILLHWVYAWGHEGTVRTVLELLKKGGSGTVGAFGLFPTLSRTRLMQYAHGLDFILAGEFEDTLAELLNGFRPGTLQPLPGLALRDQPFVPRPLMDDLSLLPVPDDVGSNLAYPTLNIAASRGCYGDCSFCFIKPYYGCSRRRGRSLASLEQELSERLSRRAAASLYFIDPTFLAPGQQERERAIAISRVARAAGLPFGFETRVDTVEETLLATLAQNGAASVFLGIESGCDSVLRRIGKRITREQISRAVQVVQGCGLQLNIGFIMFEPDSTLAELEENYTFLDGLGLLAEHELTANLLYHNQIVLHGSPAWQRFKREQRLLLDERLPFEARYCFRDERVGRVCDAMGRLSSEYFHGLERLRHTAGNERDGCCSSAAASSHSSLPVDQLNALLKEAFLAFCAASGDLPPQGFSRIEERYLGQLQSILA